MATERENIPVGNTVPQEHTLGQLRLRYRAAIAASEEWQATINRAYELVTAIPANWGERLTAARAAELEAGRAFLAALDVADPCCRSCGCTWFQPCPEGCACLPVPPLCTACEAKEVEA